MTRHKLLPTLLILLSSGLLMAKDAEKEQFNSNIARFIENKGQITDQHGNARTDIDYKLSGGPVTIYIGDGQMHYQFYKTETQPRQSLHDNRDPFAIDSMHTGMQEQADSISIYRLDVTLVGANPNAQLITAQRSDYYENYYGPGLGEDGVKARACAKLIYKDVYPGIDWVLYTTLKEGIPSLKYDFVVHSGADPSAIRLRYDGATNLQLQDGALLAETPYGSITEAAPYTYNAATHEPVNSSFILSDNELSFSLGTHSGDIVIDPNLHWATYYGGALGAPCWTVSADSNEHVYAAGHTSSANNIATSGAFLSVYPGYSSGFLAKFHTGGNLVWATYYDVGRTIRFESSTYDNGVYLLGYCPNGGTDSATAGTHQKYSAGHTECYLAYFNTAGTRIWSTYYGGGQSDHGMEITTNKEYVFFTGVTNSTTGIATTGVHQSSYTSGVHTSFLACFKKNGQINWATYYGNMHHSRGHGVACDNFGNVYMSGDTRDSSNIATAGTFMSTLNLTQRFSVGMVVKFDSLGNRIWGSYVIKGGASISCGDAGYPYTVNGNSITKFDSSGQKVWDTTFGSGSGYISSESINAGTDSKLYIAGDVVNPNIATNDGYQKTNNGGPDAFLVIFDTSGKQLYGTYLGGAKTEHIYRSKNSVAVIEGKSVFISGYTLSHSGIATANAHQYYNYGNASTIGQGFVAKFTYDTLVSIHKPVPEQFCVGDSFYVHYRTTYPFSSGNIFRVELSDSSGSFSSPLVIGSLSGTTTDSIYCGIPLSSIPGTSYHMRIRASTKADTSLATFNKIRISNVYPQALSAGSNSPVCLYDSLQLNVSSSSSGVTYRWEGIGGYTAHTDTAYRDSMIAAYDGAYIVKADLFACISYDTVVVSTQPLPYTGIYTATANSGLCQGDSLKLTVDTAATGTVYSWTGPGSYSAAVQSPVITPVSAADAGQYIVNANLNGCEQKDTVSVTVKPLPQNISATNNSPFCAGGDLVFTGTSGSSGVSYQWSGPNSFTAGNSTTTIFGAGTVHNGDYYLEVTLNGCTAIDTTTVEVYPIPAKPTLSAGSPVCMGDTVSLQAVSNTSGVVYTWSGPNSFTATTDDTAFIAGSLAATGVYTAQVSKNGCTASDTISVLVKPLPQAVTVSNNGPVCAGDTLKLSAGTSGTGVSYSWTGPASFSANTQNTFIANSAAVHSGWYIMTLGLNGCEVPDSTNAVVNPIPTTPAVSYNSPLCIGEQLQLSATSNAGASYSWLGANSYSAGQQNPVRANMQLPDTGWYKVYATLAGCVSGWDSVRVSLNPQPFVVVLPSKDSICNGDAITFTALPNNAGSNLSYIWKVNGQQVSAGTVPVYTASGLSNGDKVIVDMTDSTKCSVPFTDESNEVILKVLPWLTPSVTISANPATPLKPNEYITFTANVTNGGANPDYQWLRNGTDVLGAKSNTWSANTLNDNDSISVKVKSSYMCPQPAEVSAQGIVVTVLTGIGEVGSKESINIFPNPNDGHFVIMSTYNGSRQVQYTIHNAVGQVVHRADVTLQHGKQHRVDISHLPAGTYMLRIHTAEGQPYTAKIIKE